MTRAIASTGLPALRVVHYTLVFTDIVLSRIQREASGDPTRDIRNQPLVDAAVASGHAPYVTQYEAEWRTVRPQAVFCFGSRDGYHCNRDRVGERGLEDRPSIRQMKRET